MTLGYSQTSWYVDGINGNDNNGGSSFADAKKTISAAVTLANAGDSINVKGDSNYVYVENVVVIKKLHFVGINHPIWMADTLITNPPVISSIVRFQSASASQSSIRGFSFRIDYNNTFRAIRVEDADQVTIEDNRFRAQNFPTSPGAPNN
ncbi:MAG: hypothetical protein NZ108_04720, partial [Bacteroidia bacterium]|nr:hypothetical protein [Bacteroidia bacterium]